VIEVRDRGTGIAPGDLPHVFEPFYSRRPGGTGLGLAVCHGIVRAHAGTIELANTEPGTTATIRLPRETVRTESDA
jgi:signal transduction histidine kinase